MGYRCDTFEVSARIESVRAASDKQVRTAGAFRPMGEAVVVDGGYRATGRWPLGSGCQHSAWIVGGCRILDGDRPRLRADGSPVTRIRLFGECDQQTNALGSVVLADGRERTLRNGQKRMLRSVTS